jgi:hypothetical protein
VKNNKTIQLKAFILLIVFSLNTIVGFACAVGLNMGFNAQHNHSGSTSHSSKSHHHHDKSHHHHNGSHAHASKPHHDHEINKSGAQEKENCCNDDATRLSQSDKLLVNAINAGIEMPVALIALHFLYISHLSFFKPEIKKIQEVRPYVLNARGIRVSIQSFQI